MKNAFTILILFCLTTYSQANEIVPTRSKALHDECMRYYYGGDYATAFSKAQELLQAATEDGDKYHIVEATEVLSEFAYHRGQYKDCEKYMRSNLRLLESMENPEQKQCYYLARLGNLLRHYGDMDSSFYYARKAQEKLQLFEDGNIARINVWNDLGLLFVQNGQLDSAIFYQTNLLNLVSKKDSFFLHSLNYNLARSFEYLQNEEKEEEYLLTALSYCTSDKIVGARAKVMAKLAALFARKDQLNKAEELINESITLQEENNRPDKLSMSYVIKSSILSKQKKYSMAEAALDKANFILDGEDREKSSSYLLQRLHLAIVKNDKKAFQKYYDLTSQEMSQINSMSKRSQFYQMLATYHQSNEKYEEANKYLNNFLAVEDSLHSRANRQISASLEAKFDAEKNDLRIAALEEQEVRTQKNLLRQRKLLWTGGAVLILFLLLSFFLYRLYHKINRQKSVIQKALSEKDVLLREIHHRVKNNLQLVSSLLTLQSRSITDQTAIAAINDGKARVRSMALIHHDLYNNENLRGISVKNYIEKLSQEIFHTYNTNAELVSMELKVDDMELDVETVVPLGLILNELITNSLKYAFPGERGGQIKITLTESDGILKLELQDDGVGMDLSQFEKSTSFGNRLVSILTEQLDGTMTVNTDQGTTIKLEISGYNLAA